MKHSWLSRRLAVAAIAALLVGLMPSSVLAANSNVFVFTVLPGSTVAGVAQDIEVSVFLADGTTPDPSYNATIHFTSSDPAAVLPAPYAFTGDGTGKDNGVHRFSGGLTLKTVLPGAQTVTVTDPDSEDSNTSAPITVTPAAADHLVVAAPPAATVGTSFTVTVTALDPYDNTDTNYTGTVHFTTDDGLPTLPANRHFTSGGGQDNGVHVFTNGVKFGTVGSGTETVTATDMSDGSIFGDSGGIAVSQGTPTIIFTSTAPSGAVVGGPTYNVTTTSPSPVARVLTIDAGATGVCSIAGSTVSFIGIGTCVIDANQAGNANWLAAAEEQQSFSVDQGTPTITFTSTAPSSAVVGGATYHVTTSSPSPVARVLTIDATAASVCSIVGSTVSFIGSGTCVIDANQAANSDWLAAAEVQQSFSVTQGTPTITFTSTAPAGAVVGGATYDVTTTSPSPVARVLTIHASAASVCSIVGSTVSFIGVGTCIIDANQAANADWLAAVQAQQSFSVSEGTPTITFTSTAPSGAVVGGPTYHVTTTSPSPVARVLTIDATAAGVCSIAGSTVSFIGVGTCVIDANQAGNANWLAAPEAQQSFSVTQGTPTITFTSTAPSGAVVGGATYNVTTTSPSPVARVLTIDATAASVCSIVGSTVSFIGAGTCVIDANQAANSDWLAAPEAQQSFSVTQGTPTITFTSTAPAGAVVGGTAYNVTTTSPSPVARVLTIDATAATVCSIAGSTVSFIGVGTCVIDANQAANADWFVAAQVQQSFSVGKGAQTITFGALADKRMDESGFNLIATASSGLPVTFSSATAPVCTTSGANGATVTLVAIGTCTIHATQLGDLNWNAATMVPQSFTVSKGTATIAFTSVIPPAYVAGPTYTPTASSLSPVAIAFTIDAGSSSVCTISGGIVSFIHMGTCVIDANQPGNANWNVAIQVQQIVPVSSGIAVSFSLVVPTSAVLGVPQTISVTARDTIGLVAAAYVGTVHFTSTDLTAGLPANYTFVSGENGTHIFSSAVTFNTMGTGLQTITAADVSSPSIAGTSAQIAVGPASCTYYPLSPVRLLDTRLGIGLGGSFNSHVARSFQVTGHGNVPAGATAVTGNLTVTAQTRGGYLFAGPLPMDNPTSSTLNFPTGDDRANAVTVALGNTGTLSITYVGSGPGTAQVIFDVTGYFKPDLGGATYHPLAPARILDTRDGTGGSTSPLVSHVFRTFQVTGHGNVPGTATAVTGNLTVTGQGLGGYFFIGPVGMNDPTSSTLNFPTGDDRANAVTVKLGDGIKGTVGTLSVTYVGSGPSTAHAIFDVTGYFTQDTTGSKYVALNPSRVLDTRDGTGGSTALLGNHAARPFQVTGHGGVPVTANAVTGNLTVTSQSRNGYLFIGPVPMNDPTSSTLNFPFGDDRANAVTVALGTGPSVGMLNVTFVGSGPGQTHSIFDVTGYFVAAP